MELTDGCGTQRQYSHQWWGIGLVWERLDRKRKEGTDFTLIMTTCTEKLYLQPQAQILILSRLYSD